MSTFAERKAARTEWYEKFVKGWKQQRCTACNGSGIYDHNGSPPCGACDGSGKELVSPKESARCFGWGRRLRVG